MKGRDLGSWPSCRLFLGPGFQLGAPWNRLGQAVKTRKNREFSGKKWARYSLRSVNKEATGGITWVHGPHGPLQAPDEITARSKSEPDHGETTSEQTPSPPPRPLPKTVTRLWSPPKADAEDRASKSRGNRRTFFLLCTEQQMFSRAA
eukprot:COSAG04_NODE_6123_length_1403_cov_2.138037_1_plen_147_part_10